MSCGFSRRPPFQVIAAIDGEHAKPCEGFNRLDCNSTYKANIGVEPLCTDIAELDPDELLGHLLHDGRQLARGELTVLLCCPPCTDFSRAKPANHLVDSAKNSLVVKCADFVEAVFPEFVVMENARELVQGRHTHHYREFKRRLESLGYEVHGSVYMLSQFGLPQIRERAIVIASRTSEVKTLEDLWRGWHVHPAVTTVRHAIGYLASRVLRAGEADPADPMHQSPGFGSENVFKRMDAIPRDGGSWFELADHPEADALLINSMKARIKARDFGSHPDVYGRLWWDRPAVTIKRECAHVGNGRYAHPEQTRLLTVREMSLLQGFPDDYVFVSDSLANRYRHIGDAVPPLVSYQLSGLVLWMRTGQRPAPNAFILPRTSLRPADVRPKSISPYVEKALF